MLTLKPSGLRPASKSRVNFDHHQNKHQGNRSSHSKPVNFGPHMVNFDPPHKKKSQNLNQVKFDPSNENQVTFDSTTAIKSIRSPL